MPIGNIYPNLVYIMQTTEMLWLRLMK